MCVLFAAERGLPRDGVVDRMGLWACARDVRGM